MRHETVNTSTNHRLSPVGNIRITVITLFLFVTYNNVFSQNSTGYKVYDIDYFVQTNYKIKLYRDYLSLPLCKDSVKALLVTESETLNKLDEFKNIEYIRIDSLKIENFNVTFGKKLKYLRIEKSILIDNSIFNNIQNNNLKSIEVVNTKIGNNFNWLNRFSNLQKLGFHEVYLEKVPDIITNLKELKILYFTDNKLKTVPSFVFSLPNLKVLEIRYNNIFKLPDKINVSDSIEFLFLDGNHIHANELCKFSSSNIKLLSCVSSKLKKLPNCLFLSESFKFILLDNNKIKKLPSEEILNKVNKQKTISLSDNKMKGKSKFNYGNCLIFW